MFNPILDPSGCMKPPVSINDTITQLQKNLKFVQVKHVLTNSRTYMSMQVTYSCGQK